MIVFAVIAGVTTTMVPSSNNPGGIIAIGIVCVIIVLIICITLVVIAIVVVHKKRPDSTSLQGSEPTVSFSKLSKTTEL